MEIGFSIGRRQKGGGVNDFTIYTACLVFLPLFYQAWISFDVYLFILIDGYPIVRLPFDVYLFIRSAGAAGNDRGCV